MKKHLLSLTILTIIVVLTGCKKDGIDPNGPQGLMTKKWRITSVVMVNADGEQTDGFLDECRKDDIRNYESTGKFILETGPKHCFEEETGQVGTWELRENSKKLYMYVEGRGYYRDSIVELTGNTLKLGTSYDDYFMIETYVPQN